MTNPELAAVVEKFHNRSYDEAPHAEVCGALSRAQTAINRSVETQDDRKFFRGVCAARSAQREAYNAGYDEFADELGEKMSPYLPFESLEMVEKLGRDGIQ